MCFAISFPFLLVHVQNVAGAGLVSVLWCYLLFTIY